MPSIFSRTTIGGTSSRSKSTNDVPRSKSFGPSTPIKNGTQVHTFEVTSRLPRSQSSGPVVDEFGNTKRVSGAHESSWLPSHDPIHATTVPASRPNSLHAAPLAAKFHFHRTKVPVLASSASTTSFSSTDSSDRREYGFLQAKGRDLILGLDVIARTVPALGRELEARGLTTPMLFSNQALDLNATRTKHLIDALTRLTSSSSALYYDAFLNDVRLAREHELAWTLRWALSKIWRVQEGSGKLAHGMLNWEVYEDWRARERAMRYPAGAYHSFLSRLDPALIPILDPLMHLLSRFAAHSHLSGLTPHALASLFAPVLFGLPVSAPCSTTHAHFVEAASATEHLLLAYIRASEGPVEGLGVGDLPARLKEWVAGYPSMLASDADLTTGAPRRGARLLRCERASRTVRAYSKDLIVTAEEWAKDGKGPSAAWDTVILASRRGEGSRPIFSQGYRTKINTKEQLPLPTSSLTTIVPQAAPSRRSQHDAHSESPRWGSLADKEWGLFEEAGFGSASAMDGEANDITQMLQFDLTEGAKRSTVQKRDTMAWSDFASPDGGFNRTDPLLHASLDFSPPLQTSIAQWPQERQELHRRLHKTHKNAVKFEYDTTPLWGMQVPAEHDLRVDSKGRVWIEEAFVDAWTDVMLGCGLIDRDELTFKEANWALIGYKAKPTHPDSNAIDPRTSEQYFIFEEVVPRDYQLAIVDPKPKSMVSAFFSPRKTKKPLDADTLKRIGSKMSDDADFDAAVMRKQTRKVTLEKPERGWSSPRSLGSPVKPAGLVPAAAPLSPTVAEPRTRTSIGASAGVTSHLSPTGKLSFFSSKSKAVRRVKSVDDHKKSKSPSKGKKKGASEEELDFEMRDASGASSSGSPDAAGNQKRKDEKWIDILVASGARRMETQEMPAPIPVRAFQPTGKKGLPASPHPPPSPVHRVEPALAFRPDPPSPFVPVEDFPSSAAANGESHRAPDIKVDSPAEPHTFQVELEPKTRPASQSTSMLSPVDGIEDDGVDVAAASDSSSFAGHPDALSPAPAHHRDTVHNLIDSYDYRQGYNSSYSQDDNDETSVELESPRSVQQQDYDEDQLTPKKPVMTAYDLQPSREPSPQRYVHGEPLHFVGEEPEQEEEEDRRLREEEMARRMARGLRATA